MISELLISKGTELSGPRKFEGTALTFLWTS